MKKIGCVQHDCDEYKKREALIARLRIGYTLHQNDTPDLDAADELMGLAADILEADAKESQILQAEVDLYRAACDRRDAQQVAVPQEPVAWLGYMDAHTVTATGKRLQAIGWLQDDVCGPVTPLYAAPQPPQREPMTDDEIMVMAKQTQSAEPGRDGYVLPITFARAVLAAHHGIGVKPLAGAHNCALDIKDQI